MFGCPGANVPLPQFEVIMTTQSPITGSVDQNMSTSPPPDSSNDGRGAGDGHDQARISAVATKSPSSTTGGSSLQQNLVGDGPGDDTPTLADLLREIRETNRLLREIVLTKSSSSIAEPLNTPSKTRPPNHGPAPTLVLSEPKSTTDAPISTASERDPGISESMMDKIKHLTAEKLRSVFELDQDHMISIRDTFISHLVPAPEGETLSTMLKSQQHHDTDALFTVRMSKGVRVLVWSVFAGLPDPQYLRDRSSWRPLTVDADLKSIVEKLWPLRFVDVPTLEGVNTLPPPLVSETVEPWGTPFRHGRSFFCSLLCRSDGAFFPATTARAKFSEIPPSSLETELTSPASFWLVSLIAFSVAVCR